MRIKYLILLPLIFTALMYYSSCDDAGVNLNYFHQGVVNVTLNKFQAISPSVDGVYELWIVFDTSTGPYFRNIGSFNISPSGQIVDLSGNPKAFNLGSDTNFVNYAKYCFITIGGNGNPNDARLVAGSFLQYSDSATANLVMNDTNAVGRAMDPVINAVQAAMYILNEPTNNNNNCKSGVWFCDTLGNSSLPTGMGLDPNTSRWIFQGWVADTSNPSNPVYRSTGRFYDPYSADMDGAGPCAGNGSFYNKPGQDWVTSGNGCPGTINLGSGFCQVFITLEPANEAGPAQTSPFYVRLFWQNLIHPSLGCGTQDNLFSGKVTWNLIPSGHIQITKKVNL